MDGNGDFKFKMHCFPLLWILVCLIPSALWNQVMLSFPLPISDSFTLHLNLHLHLHLHFGIEWCYLFLFPFHTHLHYRQPGKGSLDGRNNRERNRRRKVNEKNLTAKKQQLGVLVLLIYKIKTSKHGSVLTIVCIYMHIYGYIHYIYL